MTLTPIEKLGIKSTLEWMDTSAGCFRTQLEIIDRQLKQLANPAANDLLRFITTTNLQATINQAVAERARLDQLRAKLYEVLDIPENL